MDGALASNGSLNGCGGRLKNDSTDPKFPIRILFDDGDSDTIESLEGLLDIRLSVDSTDPRNGVWIRDAEDRTVLLRCDQGDVSEFRVE